MRVAIATVQVPYLSGGAEALAEGLRSAIAAQGHAVDVITLPFRFFPVGEVERAMAVWETEDFTRLNLYDADRVVCLKFPAYGLRHPSKVLWLCHQHRAAYDLYDAAEAQPEDARLKEAIGAFDARHLPPIERRFTISKRVSERLLAFNGIESKPIYHPPPMAGRHYAGPSQPYVFYPSRFEHAKRQELLVRAAQHMRARGHIVFAGEGGQLTPLKALAEKLGVSDRVRFLGRVTPEEMLALYANSTAVAFMPRDEDYGYVTLEAMLSSKPVITCDDSGGPLEFVVKDATGLGVAPRPEEVAEAVDALLREPGRASRLGRAGRARYEEVIPGWNLAVDLMLASA